MAFALLYRSDIGTYTHHYTGSPAGDSGQHHDCLIAFRLSVYRLMICTLSSCVNKIIKNSQLCNEIFKVFLLVADIILITSNIGCGL